MLRRNPDGIALIAIILFVMLTAIPRAALNTAAPGEWRPRLIRVEMPQTPCIRSLWSGFYPGR